MATKKSAKSAATTKKAAPKKTATTVRTVKAADTSSARSIRKFKLDDKIINIMLAELVGTFVLTMVATSTATNVLPLFVGLTLTLSVLAIGAVSGSHINPAVTLGLYAARKVKGQLVPFYWVAQLLGAMAALVVTTLVANNKLSLNFSHFSEFSWPIFWVELVGTAVFLFGLVSVLAHRELSNVGRALGVGMSLFVGIVVSSTLFTAVATNVDIKEIKATNDSNGNYKLENVPHALRVSGATLNPAVALAATESTDNQIVAKLQGQTASPAKSGETVYTRLGWETILSTLAGAVVGAYLARLITYRFRG